jgi:RNA polymerase sigma factor (sigma-70 family)
MDTTDPAPLVRAAAGGDQQAWDQLVDRFSGLLWSIAGSYRLGRPDAADVLQTTWLKLLEHLDRIQDPARIGSWLATTARRECLLTLRRAGRVQPTDDDGKLDAAAGKAPGPDLALLTAERDQVLWSAFARLSAQCQRLLRVVVVAAPSYDVAAAALDMPIGSIGPTRARCLDKLRRGLAAGGISGEPSDS